MKLSEYQFSAARTSRYDQDFDDRLVTAALGIVGEVGEVVDVIKKYQGQGHELDKKKICEEVGDALWYLAEICSLCGLDMDIVAEANLAKLRDRYPQGFDAARSRERGDHG